MDEQLMKCFPNYSLYVLGAYTPSSANDMSKCLQSKLNIYSHQTDNWDF